MCVPLWARGPDGRRRMDARARILWVNPKITSPAHARFPLSLLSLAGRLAPRFDSSIVDGNLDPGAHDTVLG
jgi:hypothetical protein